MSLVYRLCRARRAHSPLDGEGARLYGGRWNPKGVPMVYTGSTLSLATLEVLVHFAFDTAPDDYVAITLRLPDDAITELRQADLPPRWYEEPAPRECQAIGGRWARSMESLALRVPSAVIPSERNVLINPMHPLVDRVSVEAKEPFFFDPRLAKPQTS